MTDEIDNEDESILVSNSDDIGRAAAKIENNDGDVQVKVVLFVEGLDDQKFWNGRVDETKCTVIQSGGKKHVIVNVEKFSEEKKVVLGIVDDDFDSLEGKVLDSPNLIATETHDLECLLLRSRAFEKVLAEHGKSQKIEKFKENENKELREALLKRGVIFGRLRWLSCKYDWEINFKHKGLQLENFIDQNWNICNQDNLFHELISQLKSPLTHDELNNLLNSLPQNVDLWKVCQGHDLIWLLARAFKKVWGQEQASEVRVASTLRGIDSTEFLATELATKVKIWECDNQPYQIFRAYN